VGAEGGLGVGGGWTVGSVGLAVALDEDAEVDIVVVGGARGLLGSVLVVSRERFEGRGKICGGKDSRIDFGSSRVSGYQGVGAVGCLTVLVP
jgi:hypothetical protein